MTRYVNRNLIHMLIRYKYDLAVSCEFRNAFEEHLYYRRNVRMHRS